MHPTTTTTMPHLPIEIILQIIDTLTDFGRVRPVAIDAKDDRARLLYSLLTVSTTVHSVAKRHLWSSCMYIDSPHRLELLLRSLNEPPFSYALQPLVTSLYLSPYHGNIDNAQTAAQIHSLFSIIGLTLKRLVSNVPLRSLYPEEDMNLVRPVLRKAYMQLARLEEFTSVSDELFLATKPDHWNNEPEPEVWASWPKLRNLALYNVQVSESWADHVKSMAHLETLALTRADGLAQYPLPQMFAQRNDFRTLRLLIINEATFNFKDNVNMGLGETYQSDFGNEVAVPDMRDFKGTVDIVNVPVTIYGGLENSIKGIQRRVRDAALADTLWAGEGWWTGVDAAMKYRTSQKNRWLY
ncbi:hypothetical protein FKW77_005629 [Venturia effusa]|uniref:Uncharacterized protein n=1 Tax=Venturia effusa TaxID=50376 RepID=A0A517LN16_9PEZI|nr:hypothetical protein FKW77_005629 [Venturia effusa]